MFFQKRSHFGSRCRSLLPLFSANRPAERRLNLRLSSPRLQQQQTVELPHKKSKSLASAVGHSGAKLRKKSSCLLLIHENTKRTCVLLALVLQTAASQPASFFYTRHNDSAHQNETRVLPISKQFEFALSNLDRVATNGTCLLVRVLGGGPRTARRAWSRRAGRSTSTTAPCATTTPRATTTASGRARAARRSSKGASKVRHTQHIESHWPCEKVLIRRRLFSLVSNLSVASLLQQDKMITSARRPTSAPSTRTAARAASRVAFASATKSA